MPLTRAAEAGRASAPLLVAIVLGTAGLAWLGGRNWKTAEPHPVARSEPPSAGTRPPAEGAGTAIPSESDGSRARHAEDRPSAPREAAVPSPSADLAGCLRDKDAEAVRECLRSRLDARPESARIAHILCSDTENSDQHLILVTEAMSRIPAAEVLEWLDDLQTRCRRYQESDFLSACLLARRGQDPSWFAGFRSTLTPERLFDPSADEAGIQIAALFIREGDPEVRDWIQAGARGEFGGTLRQIDRAIGVSISMQAPGEEWLSNLRSIIQSADIPEGGALGSTFVHALLDSRAWPNNSSAPALDTLVTVLYDPRFQDSAAATLCLSFTPHPPNGCDAAMWDVVRSRALEVAAQIGLSIPGQSRR